MSHQHRNPERVPGVQCLAFAEVWPVLNEPATDMRLLAEARAHLASCDYCQEQVTSYEQLDRKIRQYLGPSGPPIYRTEDIVKEVFEDASELPTYRMEDIVKEVLEDTSERGAAQPPALLVPAATRLRQERGRRLVSGLAALVAVVMISVMAATLFTQVAPHRSTATISSPTTSLEKGAQWFLHDIAMVSPSEGWAVGEASPPDAQGGALTRALLMHYQHGAWSPIVLPIQGRLRSLSMISATDGWAVGQSNEVGALLLHYDGHNWKQVSGAACPPYRVQMLSTTAGWAFGEDCIMRYDGHTWQLQPLPASLEAGKTQSVSLLSVSMLSSAEGWAVGFTMPIFSPAPGATDTRSAATLPDGIILHFTAGQWTVQKTFHHMTLNSVAMLSASDGWIAGRTEVATSSGGQQEGSRMISPLLLRYSGGQWVQVSQPVAGASGELRQVVMLSPTDGWITASGDLAGNYLLHYNGATWSTVRLPKGTSTHGYALAALSMLSAQEGWAAGSLTSDRAQGIPNTRGGYQPTVTPIFLHYLNGTWSIDKS